MGFPYPYPLGLPKGSVRSTITLLLSIDLLLLMMYDSKYAESMTTVVVVALTFYFGGRMRGAPVPRDKSDKSIRAWGLPAGTIRTILILLYGGFSVFYYLEHSSLPNYLLEIIYIIAGYLIGHYFNKVRRHFFHKDTGSVSIGFLDHLKAIVMLGVTITTLIITLITTDPAQIFLWINLASIILGFYFGERG
ncbi:MAG: hypothetical protein OEZ01_03210 [Candidatus Heimdallarchaeota archaeon]|nr:hypothetical protein [Candidatus Heimdallarchaeota archaeon]MDH5644986.1 hypothetical protein [Candidatus Heimdallarchaeota archaeon]